MVLRRAYLKQRVSLAAQHGDAQDENRDEGHAQKQRKVHVHAVVVMHQVLDLARICVRECVLCECACQQRKPIAGSWCITKTEKAESEAQRGKPKGTLESESRNAIL